jgi:trehalose-phosphatase
LKEQYQRSKNRILLLDYDGTLSPIANKPHLATPSDNLMKILKKIASVCSIYLFFLVVTKSCGFKFFVHIVENDKQKQLV